MPTPDRAFRRRSIRLPDWDYRSSGPYFITLCARDGHCVFGEILERRMVPNDLGRLVEKLWLETSRIRPGVVLDAHVLMPNHFHAIVILPKDSSAGAHSRAPEHGRGPRSLGSLVAGFKAAVTSRARLEGLLPWHPLWQRNYHERIIRSPLALDRVRGYVLANPRRWNSDPEHPTSSRRILTESDLP